MERIGSWTLMTQPPGWEERATRITLGKIAVLVLGLLDLAYNKLEAARAKDDAFLREAFAARLLTPSELEEFVTAHAPTPKVRIDLLKNLRRLTETP